MTPDESLAAALRLARCGYRVFPLQPRAKVPVRGLRWKEAATAHPDSVVRLWQENGGLAFNIGVACSGDLLVVDIDGGEDEWERLVDEHCVPPTVTAKTRKGHHYYFEGRHPRRGNKARVHGLPIDVRSVGGYVVAPPSVHPDGDLYVWERSPWLSDLSECPVSLQDFFFGDVTEQRPAGALFNDNPDDTEDRLVSALAYIPPDDYDTWLGVGMALHKWESETGGCGRALWDTWSQGSPKFDHKTQRSTWRSFKPGNARAIGLGTVFEWAKRGGWTPAPRVNEVILPPTPQPVAPQAKPEIRVTTNTKEMARKAAYCLRAPGVGLYEMGGALVALCDGAGGRVHTRSVGKATLEGECSDLAKWIKPSKEGEMVATKVPERVVSYLHENIADIGLPSLRAITDCPTMREDGSLLVENGYDRESGVYLQHSGGFEPVPDNPTIGDARGALDLLGELLHDFPFLAPHHLSAAIGAVMTAVLRPAIKGPTPLFLVTSSTPGTGKSLLVDLVSIIATGHGASRFAPPRREEEIRKALTSLVLESPRIVLIDNVDRPIGGPSLDAAITSDELSPWTDRLLGSSSIVRAPFVCSWFATGNNMAIKGDLARRSIVVRMEANLERPEERGGFIHPDVKAWAIQRRNALVRAVLTIARAYWCAGRPRPQIPKMGSFEAWSEWVRHPLVWCGLDDPRECLGDLGVMTDGDSSAGVVNFLETVHAILRSKWWTGRDIARAITDATVPVDKRVALRECLEDMGFVRGGDVDRKALGLEVLRKYPDRMFGDYVLRRGDSTRNGRRYAVEYKGNL